MVSAEQPPRARATSWESQCLTRSHHASGSVLSPWEAVPALVLVEMLKGLSFEKGAASAKGSLPEGTCLPSFLQSSLLDLLLENLTESQPLRYGGYKCRMAPKIFTWCASLAYFPMRESGTWNMVPQLCCVAWQRIL